MLFRPAGNFHLLSLAGSVVRVAEVGTEEAFLTTQSLCIRLVTTQHFTTKETGSGDLEGYIGTRSSILKTLKGKYFCQYSLFSKQRCRKSFPMWSFFVVVFLNTVLLTNSVTQDICILLQGSEA